MAQSIGRIPCSQCGANNFEAAPVCWQCGVALRAGPGANQPPVASQPRWTGAQADVAIPNTVAPHLQAVSTNTTGDSGVARRAALYLALSFPYFGLPIGWAFMMTPDARKQAIGRYCAYWSAAALAVHIVLMFYAAMAMSSVVTKFTPGLNTEKQLEDQIRSINGH